MRNTSVRLMRRRRGASLSGYGILVGLVAVAAIGSTQTLGGKAERVFDDSTDAMTDGLAGLPVEGPGGGTGGGGTGETGGTGGGGTGTGGTGTDPVTGNTAPAWAAPPAPPTGYAGSRYIYRMDPATDADGDTLTYSVSGLPDGFGIALLVGRWPVVEVSGTPAATGTYPATLTVTDGRGGTVSHAVNIVVEPNRAPEWTISGLPPSGRSGAAYSWSAPPATDPEGDAITYSASNVPNGLTFYPSTRSISGTPAAGGEYTVVLQAQDSKGGIIQKSVTISIAANLSPTWTTSAPPAVQSGVPYSWTPEPAVDPEGDPLVYTASNLPHGLSVDPMTGTISGTTTQIGWYLGFLTVYDGLGGSARSSFLLTVE